MEWNVAAKSPARALSLAVALAALAARAELPPVEEAVESTTEATLVATDSGVLSVRSCLSCPEQLLTLTSQTAYFIGETAVTFVEFKQRIGGAPGAQPLALYYRPSDRTVTRVVLSQ